MPSFRVRVCARASMLCQESACVSSLSFRVLLLVTA